MQTFFSVSDQILQKLVPIDHQLLVILLILARDIFVKQLLPLLQGVSLHIQSKIENDLPIQQNLHAHPRILMSLRMVEMELHFLESILIDLRLVHLQECAQFVCLELD